MLNTTLRTQVRCNILSAALAKSKAITDARKLEYACISSQGH